MNDLQPAFQLSTKIPVPSSSSSNKQQRGGFRTVPCRNLATTGYCRYGDRCTFAHSNTPMTPSSLSNERDPFNPTWDDPVSPVYPIRKQLRKPSFEAGSSHPTRGRQLGFEPSLEGMFALGTGAAPKEEDVQGDEAAWRRGEERLEQEEAKRAKNQYYRTKPCKLYAQGICVHGSSCSFLHSDEHTPSISVRAPSASPSINSASRGGSSSSKPMSPNRLLYKTSPCRFYSTATGAASCTKGEHCTFLHGEEKTSWRERAARREKNSGSAAGEGGGEDDKHRLWRTEPCVYYQQGKCSRGDSCNYLHVAASGNQTPLGRKPCKIYAENGYCKWGTECRYVHQIPETSLPYINGVGLDTSGNQTQPQTSSSSSYRDPSASDSEDEDDFEVVLDQGEPSAASTPTGTTVNPTQGEEAQEEEEEEEEEEEIVLARDVHLAFKHLSVAPRSA